MASNSNLEGFCTRWFAKAATYDTSKLNQCVDKFVTLFIVYNALYVENAIYLHKKAEREGRNDYALADDRFPDLQAATKYVLDTVGSRKLMEALNDTQETEAALRQIESLMRNDFFCISLDPVRGGWQEDKDKELLKMLRSSSSDEQARAILRIIYEVRCNLFHGRKGLNPLQPFLLEPLAIILEKVARLLHKRLSRLLESSTPER